MTLGETVDGDTHLILWTIQEGRTEDEASTDLNTPIGTVIE